MIGLGVLFFWSKFLFSCRLVRLVLVTNGLDDDDDDEVNHVHLTRKGERERKITTKGRKDRLVKMLTPPRLPK